MNVRELKDNGGVVFSPKVSTESIYLKGSTTNLDSKLSSMDTAISGKMNNVSLAAVATSGSYTDLSNRPNYAGSSSEGGIANSSYAISHLSRLESQEALDGFIEKSKLKYGVFAGITSIGFDSNDGIVLSISWDTSNTYGAQLAFDDSTSGLMKVRGKSQSWGDWRTIIMSGVTNPDITASGFYVSSSRTVKENIKPTTINGEDMVNSVDVVDFTYKTDEKHNPKIGFIAEDTDPLLSTPEQKRMDFSNCIGVMMKAIQELSAKVKTLTNKLESLTPHSSSLDS